MKRAKVGRVQRAEDQPKSRAAVKRQITELEEVIKRGDKQLEKIIEIFPNKAAEYRQQHRASVSEITLELSRLRNLYTALGK